MLEGRPEVKEYFVDSKKHVDRQLKLACEDFISSRTAAMVGQLQDFLTRADAVVELSRRDPHNTKVNQSCFDVLKVNTVQGTKRKRFRADGIYATTL